MAADLEIPLQLICSFEHIVAFENRIQAKFLAHFQHGPLELPFFFQRVMICEEVQLKNRFQVSQSDPVKEAYYTSTYERVLQLSKMYYSPYFGMIDYLDKTLDNEEFCYYIGRSGLSRKGEPVILDWRTPAASLFYQQRLGEMVFRAPAGNREVDLKHRRQYIIKKGAAVLIAERKKSTLLYYAVLSMLFVFPVMLSDNESLMKTLYDKRVMLTVIAVSAAAVPLAVYLCRLLSRKGKKYAVSMGALLLSITLLLTFSSGCKATQLNQRLIVQGIGIDKTPTGCCITLITLDTGSLKEENTITIRNYEGESIDSAFRNSEYTSGKKLMLSQCLFIIMNRSACKEADNILGYFAKQKEIIKTANIMTSEGTAEDTIKTAVNDYKYHSEDISIISDSSVSDQPVPHFTLFDYISEKDNPSHEILLPVIKTDNKTSSLTCKRGLVLMREKNAVFELNEKQTSAALANSKNRR